MSLRTPLSLTALALATMLAGCSTPIALEETKAPAPVPVVTAQPGTGGSTGNTARPNPTPQSQVPTVDLAKQQAEREAAARAAAANLPRVLYFDYDSFLLRADDKPVLEGHAKALVAQPNLRMNLEGHADERGGREYNLALGQKRAEAVARALELLGVKPSQVEAVSFGEESPADKASNEAAWSKNRRVELKGR